VGASKAVEKHLSVVVNFGACPAVTNRVSAWTLVVPLWFFLLLQLFASNAQSQSAGGPDEGVRYARIAPNVVHLELVDGTDIHFSRLSRTKGISQTRVVAIAQDERGFMWFATQYGLNRYDGYSLRQFKHVDADPGSVSDSYIRCLFKDREGRL
jgi:hypothetical protein